MQKFNLSTSKGPISLHLCSIRIISGKVKNRQFWKAEILTCLFKCLDTLNLNDSVLGFDQMFVNTYSDIQFHPIFGIRWHTGREDGYIDAWDILYQQKSPILSFKVSDTPLNSVKVNYIPRDSDEDPSSNNQVQSEGFLISVGSNDGNTSMFELSSSLSQCTRSYNNCRCFSIIFSRILLFSKILDFGNKQYL